MMCDRIASTPAWKTSPPKALFRCVWGGLARSPSSATSARRQAVIGSPPSRACFYKLTLVRLEALSSNREKTKRFEPPRHRDTEKTKTEKKEGRKRSNTVNRPLLFLPVLLSIFVF